MDQDKLHLLVSAVEKIPQADYPAESRTHPLRSFPGQCFLKRDDELGFGITGSKIRKFRSLLPALKAKIADMAIIIGGPYSNNILGLVQLLIENGIEPIVFMRGDPNTPLVGNHLLIRMLIPESNLHWITRLDWTRVDEMAARYAEELISKGKYAFVIPEGSALPESIAGAASLAIDIMRNEKQLGFSFDRIFIDAGTGMTAAVTILAYAWIKNMSKFSIVLLADSPDIFRQKLGKYHRWFQEFLGTAAPMPEDYELIVPNNGKSFGSVNKSIISTIIEFGRVEGVLVDPIYSAKLLLAAKEAVKASETTLIVHSGGGLTLSGYQEMLAEKIIRKS